MNDFQLRRETNIVQSILSEPLTSAVISMESIDWDALSTKDKEIMGHIYWAINLVFLTASGLCDANKSLMNKFSP